MILCYEFMKIVYDFQIVYNFFKAYRLKQLCQVKILDRLTQNNKQGTDCYFFSVKQKTLTETFVFYTEHMFYWMLTFYLILHWGYFTTVKCFYLTEYPLCSLSIPNQKIHPPHLTPYSTLYSISHSTTLNTLKIKQY